MVIAIALRGVLSFLATKLIVFFFFSAFDDIEEKITISGFYKKEAGLLKLLVDNLFPGM